MEEEYESTVEIVETAGGNWAIYSDGCRVDDGFFRRASDAQEFCNANNWEVASVKKYNQ